MRKNNWVPKLLLILVTIFLPSEVVFAQQGEAKKSITIVENQNIESVQHSIGASLWMLYNFFPDAADYYLITYGYQPNKHGRFFLEFNTWKYEEPIGTYGSSEENYPGYIREFGIGAGYQRFIWKGVFTTVQATSFYKLYFDEEGDKIQNGFQLYMQFVVGYQINLFQNKWYIEPAYALKYWPIDTNFPENFEVIEKGSPNTIFEPSLNFGYRF